MIVSLNYKQLEVVRDNHHLEDILSQRDERGGAEFWISDDPKSYPCLAIVVSGDKSFAIYFPEEGHPGFRCLRSENDPSKIDGSTNFVWLGCDPASGELVPNEFVVPLSTSISAAQAFFLDRSLPNAFSWFEL